MVKRRDPELTKWGTIYKDKAGVIQMDGFWIDMHGIAGDSRAWICMLVIRELAKHIGITGDAVNDALAPESPKGG